MFVCVYAAMDRSPTTQPAAWMRMEIVPPLNDKRQYDKIVKVAFGMVKRVIVVRPHRS